MRMYPAQQGMPACALFAADARIKAATSRQASNFHQHPRSGYAAGKAFQTIQTF